MVKNPRRIRDGKVVPSLSNRIEFEMHLDGVGQVTINAIVSNIPASYWDPGDRHIEDIIVTRDNSDITDNLGEQEQGNPIFDKIEEACYEAENEIRAMECAE